MKVYALIHVTYEYYRVEYFKGVFTSIEAVNKWIEGNNKYEFPVRHYSINDANKDESAQPKHDSEPHYWICEQEVQGE